MPDGIALVTGATGSIGPSLVGRLIDNGYQVRALVRQTPLPDTLLPSTAIYQGGINNKDAVQKAITDVDTVFHLAAKLHITNPDPALRAEYERINIEGTRNVVEAAQAAGVRRIVFFSTISVYGPSQHGQTLSETSPLQPATLYAQTKLQAENIVLAARQKDNDAPLGVILRLATVYGPRIKGNYARLVSALRKGWFMPVGDGHNRRTLVYTQDVASAALLAAQHPAAAGEIYNVTDGNIHSIAAILAAMCQALGRPQPRLRLPVTPVRLAAATIETGFKLVGKSAPLGRATLDKLLEDVAVSGDNIQQQLGFRPEFDLLTGWLETVRHIID